MKRIKSLAAFVCGIVLIVFGAALLLWQTFGIQGALRTLLGVEIIITGVSVLLYSLSYEGSNNDRKHPPDERSDDIRMRAKAWSFDIVTRLMMIMLPILSFFLDSQTGAIVAVTAYGILAVGMLLQAALLIFYERNM